MYLKIIPNILEQVDFYMTYFIMYRNMGFIACSWYNIYLHIYSSLSSKNSLGSSLFSSRYLNTPSDSKIPWGHFWKANKYCNKGVTLPLSFFWRKAHEIVDSELLLAFWYSMLEGQQDKRFKSSHKELFFFFKEENIWKKFL